MYNRIFVPVDDSQTSKQALVEACQLAKTMQAGVRLVHVVDLAQFGWGGTEFLDASELQDSIKQAGGQVLEQASQVAREQGVEPETQILESWGDKISAVLMDDANAWGADLIVMGTHGYSGLMHILMGSVAEGLLKLTDVPVLLVRSQEED